MNTVISLLLLYMFNSLHKDTYYEIAKGLLDHISDLQTLSVAAFAAEMGTSVSTVNKFCKELGFQNFRTLKTQLENTRKGRVGQIAERMKETDPDRILDAVDGLLPEPVNRREILFQAQTIADRFFSSRYAYISGAVCPMALSLNFIEDLFLMGCKVRIIHNTYQGVEEPADPADFLLILSNTGRFITMNSSYFLSIYTKNWNMAVISQNEQFAAYDKISSFLQLPVHPESPDDNVVMLLLLNLIEYLYYQRYFSVGNTR